MSHVRNALQKFIWKTKKWVRSIEILLCYQENVFIMKFSISPITDFHLIINQVYILKIFISIFVSTCNCKFLLYSIHECNFEIYVYHKSVVNVLEIFNLLYDYFHSRRVNLFSLSKRCHHTNINNTTSVAQH